MNYKDIKTLEERCPNLTWIQRISRLREEVEELRMYIEAMEQLVVGEDWMVQPPCKTHPDAPHGFLRNASHNAGRYVCECEHWKGSE
jgi:hypothetical protein